ncbi:TIGR00269 family protein [Candidatus Pacearchaeota archaeon]|nr:TIGR00269 family protein [Candidatus Pacearchaeota archaeon]
MNIQEKVKKTLKKAGIKKKDKIVVALSGGKDSSVAAYLLKKIGYKNIQGFHINLNIGKYSEECLERVVELSQLLDIELKVYDMKKEMGSGMCYLRSGIQSKSKNEIKNCAICGVIKKWILNREVRKLKEDYIATGHNLDDEAQTFLMNIFKGSPQLSANLGPKSRNIPKDKKKSKFIPRVKPLFYIPEDEIRKYSKSKKLPVVYEGCPCALDSYRIQIRSFLENISNKDKKNIVKNFEKLLPRIQKTKDPRMEYCDVCGEPSRGRICKKCRLMKIRERNDFNKK